MKERFMNKSIHKLEQTKIIVRLKFQKLRKNYFVFYFGKILRKSPKYKAIKATGEEHRI